MQWHVFLHFKHPSVLIHSFSISLSLLLAFIASKHSWTFEITWNLSSSINIHIAVHVL